MMDLNYRSWPWPIRVWLGVTTGCFAMCVGLIAVVVAIALQHGWFSSFGSALVIIGGSLYVFGYFFGIIAALMFVICMVIWGMDGLIKRGRDGEERLQ